MQFLFIPLGNFIAFLLCWHQTRGVNLFSFYRIPGFWNYYVHYINFHRISILQGNNLKLFFVSFTLFLTCLKTIRFSRLNLKYCSINPWFKYFLFQLTRLIFAPLLNLGQINQVTIYRLCVKMLIMPVELGFPYGSVKLVS